MAAATSSTSAGAESNPGNFETPADTVTLGELTVTALKQGSLFESPSASSRIGAPEVERLDAFSMKGISDVVPNFFVPDYGSRKTSSIYVRGIGARIDQAAVGLNVDNVPFFNKDAYDFDLVDIADVEMLRGPQSTLYGRNTMAGLINITTLSPLRYQGVRALAEYGSGDTWRLSGSVYTKPAAGFGLSASVFYTRSAGFFLNQYNGKRTDKENQLSFRIKAEWEPSDSFYILNTFAAGRLRQGGYPYQYIPTGQISYNDACFYRRNSLNDGLTVRYTHERFTLVSMTSLQYLDDHMTLDQDFLPEPYFTLTQKRRELVWTQDFVAKSRSAGAYSWLTGVFGFYRNMHMQAPVNFLDSGIRQLIEQHRNNANPNYPIAWDSRNLLLDSHFSNPGFGVALYHQSKLEMGEKWQLTAGLRLDFERNGLRYRSLCNSGYTIFHGTEANGEPKPFRHIPVEIDQTGHLHSHFLELLPKLAVLYRLPESIGRSNIYASVSKGYKAGGFNTQMFSDVLQQRLMGVMGIGASYDVEKILSYKPEKSWNYEVGAHYESFDGRWIAELSAFYIDCRDQQLTMFPDGTTTGRIMTNAGKTRSFGAEISITASPWTPLTLQASYGYTNATFRRFFNGMNDFSGKRVPYAPSNTLFVGVSYLWLKPFMKARSLELTADMTGTGSICWNESNTQSQNFYALAGANLSLAFEHFSLALWVKNIFDTRYDTFYFVSMGNEFLQRGKPRTMGVTLRMNL